MPHSNNDPPNGAHQELVERLSRGDEDAFQPLCKAWRRKVRSSVWHFGDIADDVTQEAFLRVLKHAKEGTLDPNRNVLALLRRIAKNAAIDAARRINPGPARGPEPQLTAASKMPPNIPELDEPQLDPAEVYLTNEEADRVKACLESLPDRQRKIIFMLVYEGYTQTEIAQALGISNALVTSEKKIAYEKIEKCIGRDSKLSRK